MHAIMSMQIEIVEKEIKGRTMYVVGDSVVTFNRAEAEAMLDETGLIPIDCELSQKIIISSIPPGEPVKSYEYKGSGHGLIKSS